MVKDLQDAQASIIAAIKRIADHGGDLEPYLHALAFLQELEFDRLTFDARKEDEYTGLPTKTSQTCH